MSVRDADREALATLIGDAPGFVLEDGPVTAVRAIELDGLDTACHRVLSHGADIRPSKDLSSGAIHVA
ncbi:hypothetical protein KCV01_g22860, partial [Aureobasidium melanogenum]